MECIVSDWLDKHRNLDGSSRVLSGFRRCSVGVFGETVCHVQSQGVTAKKKSRLQVACNITHWRQNIAPHQ